jgi:hypothetical protein
LIVRWGFLWLLVPRGFFDCANAALVLSDINRASC